MFVAENGEKKIILARDYQRGTEGALYCPSCQGEVIYKQGQWTLPHFAHRTLGDCNRFSEGESLEHLQGKLLLYQWTKTSQLEAYLPELKQRPDLLWGKLAMEFQCSHLPMERFFERTENYLRHHYLPWWFLGEKLQPKKRFGPLQRACCYYQKEQGLKLWAVDVVQEEIRLFHQIYWHYSQAYPHHIQKFSLSSFQVKDVLSYVPQKKNPPPWKPFRFKQRLKQKLFQLDKKILHLQEKLYLEGSHVLYLPEACYERSLYFFFFEEELLYLRFCFLKSASFAEWHQHLFPALGFWPYPLVSQEEILFAVYQECLQLFS